MNHTPHATEWTARHADGQVCTTATTTQDCPRSHDYTRETVDRISRLVATVANHLPFPVTLDADMGGTFALHINLGHRWGTDDPPDRAGIDPDSDSAPYWWVDLGGGDRVIVSDHGLHTDPTIVAAWITTTARNHNSPAAVDRSNSASCQHYIDTGHYLPVGTEGNLA